MSDISRKDYSNWSNPIEGASEEEIDKALESITETPDSRGKVSTDTNSGSPTNLGAKALSPEARVLVDEASQSIEHQDRLENDVDPEIRKFMDRAFTKPKSISEKAQSATASIGPETGVVTSEDTSKMNLDDVDELLK